MERLLNIKEAAEFLNVSEMTVRRWTNTGSLQCYRVGGRRARRFKAQDLMAYLEGKDLSTDSVMVQLGFNGFEVPDGSHITHLSVDPYEALEVAAAFVIEGLVNGETVCVVAPDVGTEKVINALGQHNTDVEKFKESGKLHFSRGMDTPQRQRRYIAEMAAQSGKRFRIFGDMTWIQAKGWRTEDLRGLEEACNLSPSPRDLLFLCQYVLDSFTGKQVMMAIENHSHSIYRGVLKENPYRQ